MTTADLMFLLLAMRAFELLTLGIVAIVLCSIWPRKTWELNDHGERSERVG